MEIYNDTCHVIRKPPLPLRSTVTRSLRDTEETAAPSSDLDLILENSIMLRSLAHRDVRAFRRSEADSDLVLEDTVVVRTRFHCDPRAYLRSGVDLDTNLVKTLNLRVMGRSDACRKFVRFSVEVQDHFLEDTVRLRKKMVCEKVRECLLVF